MAGALLLQGCGWAPHPMLESRPGGDPASWRAIATDRDRAKLRNWRDDWVAGLNAAKKADSTAADFDDTLFNPDSGLASPMPPVGAYRCRSYRLGGTTPDMPDFRRTGPVECQVARDGDRLRLTVEAGQQRPDGVIFPDTNGRAIFLGTLILSGETTAIDYARDDRRDIIGRVSRIGDRRWRLAIPGQAFGPKIELIELMPAT